MGIAGVIYYIVEEEQNKRDKILGNRIVFYAQLWVDCFTDFYTFTLVRADRNYILCRTGYVAVPFIVTILFIIALKRC